MSTALETHVLQLVGEKRPASILALGPGADVPFRGYLRAHPQCRLEHLAREALPAALEGLGRFEFGYVARTLEHMPPEAAEKVLSRMRDLHAKRLCVVLPVEGAAGRRGRSWSHEELIARGLTLLARYEEAGEPLHLYGFDVATYKRTPDWLNPRHWAHPELWDRYRW